MANELSIIVQRLWNYCNVLRDDGVSYRDYVERLMKELSNVTRRIWISFA